MGLTVSRPIFALVPVALVLVLSSCGGGDDSSKPAATATGPTATASKPPAGATSGATGTTGTSGPERSKGTRKQRGSAQTDTRSSSGGTKAQKRKGSEKTRSKRDGKGPGPRADFTAKEWQLYKQTKTVCGGLGVDPLANQYHVKKDPEPVAAAYADAYAKVFGKDTRDAVYRGCKTGLAG